MRSLRDSVEALESEMSQLPEVGLKLAAVRRDRSHRAAGALLRNQEFLTGTAAHQCPADLSEQI
jgi:hypothetical protein